jgi:hypothetical protein
MYLIFLSCLRKIKTAYRSFSFLFDYYIGYFMYNENMIHRWEQYMKDTYPEKFKQYK